MAEGLKVNPSTRVDQVGHTGIYPASGPWPPGDAPIRGQGELAHPEERAHRVALASLSLLALGIVALLGMATALLLRASAESSTNR
jgi:hypothetical protein